uniref:Chromosome 10 open reading frame 67 n=1 Tax=Xenopus tropicalis TaxID=8364 RepID=A0A803JTW2_XENTR
MEPRGNSAGEDSEECFTIEMLLRPSISDQLRVGFFGTDHATQTDVSEVLELKEVTGVMQSLVKSVDDLKKDIVYQKNLLQAEYKQKIEEQAVKLYEQMTCTVQDLEEVYKKKVSTLRKSYQQQLINSLAVIKANYEGSYTGGTALSGSASSAKVQTLKKKLFEKDIVIQTLEARISELEQSDHPKQIIFEAEDDPEKKRLEEENKEMKGKIDELYENAQKLEDVLRQKEKQIRLLDLDVGSMKQKMEKDQQTIEKLSSAQEKLKIDLENEKATAAKLLNQQKDEMEMLLEAKLKEQEKQHEQMQQEYQSRILEEQRQKLKHIREAESIKQKLQSAKPTSPQIKTPDVSRDTETLLAQIKKLAAVKEEQEKNIEGLRRELDRINRTWEKKFEILKQSFHAIKDEMFLRQSLHRQSLSLQKVSVSYMTNENTGEIPSSAGPKNSFYFPANPLPQIGTKTSPSRLTHMADSYADYQEQVMVTENELQVVSDDEEDLEDVHPLPPPPNIN